MSDPVEKQETVDFSKCTPQQLAQMFGEVAKKTIEAAQGKSKDDWQMANRPFQEKTEGEQQAEKYAPLISRPKAETDAKKAMQFFNTGTFLDGLFLNEKDEPAHGIPVVVQLGVVGNPEVGKSILVQEIALKAASNGKKVIFVTSEDSWNSPSPRFDLQARFQQKAEAIGINWETVRNNLFVLDTITNSSLRDWSNFVETYRYLVEILKGIDLLVVDSLTLLESYRGALKYRVMELARYNQSQGITAIYVSQRASEENVDKLGYAGGVGIAHNLDGTVCIDFKKATNELKADINRTRTKDEQIKQWDTVHFVRMLGCRLSGFDRKYYEVEITKDGFIKLVQPSEE